MKTHFFALFSLLIVGLFLIGCSQNESGGYVTKTKFVSAEVDGAQVVDIKAQSVVSGSTKKVISETELSKHNTEEDCLVAYDGKVYDITEFILKHKAPLGSYCGTNKEFEEAYMGKHKGTKDDILNQFVIGVLE